MRDVPESFRRFGVVLLALVLITVPVAAQASVAPTEIWSNPNTTSAMIDNTDNNRILAVDNGQLTEIDTTDGSTVQTETVSLASPKAGVYAEGYYIVTDDNDPGLVYGYHASNLSQAWSLTLTGTNTPSSTSYNPGTGEIYITTFGNGGYINVITPQGSLENQISGVGDARSGEYADGSLYVGLASDSVLKRDVGALGTNDASYATAGPVLSLYATDDKLYGMTSVGSPNYFELHLSNFTEARTDTLSVSGTSMVKTFEETGLILVLDEGDDEVTGYNQSLGQQWVVSDVTSLVQYRDDWVIDDTTENVTFYVEDAGTSTVAYETSVGSPPPEDQETSLELEIDRWQPFNSTQEYTVYLNETNTTTGDTTLTDVSADANVTVYNITNTTNFTSPIVTVNNTSDTLVSHQSTGVVAVNATYDGNTLGNATNLTVGNRNLTNIGIMPPSQWLASFLELDSVSGPHGIGSPTQWILFIVLIMVGATHLADNGWAGLGGGVLTAILLWILNYIDLGTVLSTVFVVTLLSLALLKARRLRSVTSTGGQQ